MLYNATMRGPKSRTTKQFIELANSVHNNFYTFDDKCIYKASNKKVTILCPIHGYFNQLASGHLSGRGCRICANDSMRMGIEEFEYRASKTHNNFYTYCQDYISAKKKVTIICPLHGNFFQKAASHLEGVGCRKCFSATRKISVKDFEERANLTHNNFYIYYQDYTDSATKVQIGCPYHGDFYQIPGNHLMGSGCYECGNDRRTLSISEFESKAKLIHNNLYTYYQDYIDTNTRILIHCPIHGDFEQFPRRHLQGGRCTECWQEETDSRGVMIIKQILREYNIKFDIEVTFNGLVGDYNYPLFFDFYLSEHNLLIEFDGEQHFRLIRHWDTPKRFEMRQKYDQYKNEFAIANNIELLRITYKNRSAKKIKDIILNALF